LLFQPRRSSKFTTNRSTHPHTRCLTRRHNGRRCHASRLTSWLRAKSRSKLAATARVKSGVQCFQIGFQIEAQIPVIEVTRTDAHPVIDQHHFQVQETRLVLENLHPGLEQSRVVAVPGVAHGRVIGARPGQQQAHIDASASRAAQ
jgi:hypothetical protein